MIPPVILPVSRVGRTNKISFGLESPKETLSLRHWPAVWNLALGGLVRGGEQNFNATIRPKLGAAKRSLLDLV